MANTYPYKEQWLSQAVEFYLRPYFTAQGHNIPERVRVSTGWPSRGAMAKRNRVIGQAFAPDCSADGTSEVIVSVYLDDPVEVLGVLVHECLHHAVGIDAKHGKPFKDGMRAVGLEGKVTATKVGDDLLVHVRNWVEALGAYPHARLDGKKKPGQVGRMLKWKCQKCGLIVRSTQKWHDTYPNPWPCPCGEQLEFVEPPAEKSGE